MTDRARILVVDDIVQNVRLLEAVLAPRGYDVVTATDGRSALELVGAAPPDLVLLDVHDAGARRLRGLPAAACERPRRRCCR